MSLKLSNSNVSEPKMDSDNEEKSSQTKGQKMLNRKVWSQKEDKTLERAIQQLGTNWKEVAKRLINRNPSQCAQRWKRIKPAALKSRNQWTQSEDEQLLELVKLHNTNWGVIANIMNKRTGKQIRERYINKLNPDIKNDPWTMEEDQIILNAYSSLGSKWTDISKLLVGRPENMIKNRFYSFIRREYMHIQNPYYIIPNENKKKIDDEQSKKQAIKKQKSKKKIQKNKIKQKISKKPKSQLKLNKPNEADEVKQENVKEENLEYHQPNILDGFIPTNSSNEVKEEVQDEIKQQDEEIEKKQEFLSILPQQSWFQFASIKELASVQSQFNSILLTSNQINNSSYEPLMSLHASQNQVQPQLKLATIYYQQYYCDGANNISKPEKNLSPLKFNTINQSQPTLFNTECIQPTQSQLVQMQMQSAFSNVSNFNFNQIPPYYQFDSYPHSLNNSQI